MPQKKKTSSWSHRPKREDWNTPKVSSYEAHRISGPERGPATKDELQDLSDKTQATKRHSKKDSYSKRKEREKKATRWKPKEEKRQKRKSKNVIDRTDKIKSLIEELDRQDGRPTS